MAYSESEQFVRERTLVYLSKNRDYGDAFTSSLEKYGDVAFFVRAHDKMKRIETLLKLGSSIVQDEKIADTILDLYNYSVMFKMWKDNTTTLSSFVGECYRMGAVEFKEFLKEYGITPQDAETFFEAVVKYIPAQ